MFITAEMEKEYPRMAYFRWLPVEKGFSWRLFLKENTAPHFFSFQLNLNKHGEISLKIYFDKFKVKISGYNQHFHVWKKHKHNKSP